jgi:hypothetical protein
VALDGSGPLQLGCPKDRLTFAERTCLRHEAEKLEEKRGVGFERRSGVPVVSPCTPPSLVFYAKAKVGKPKVALVNPQEEDGFVNATLTLVNLLLVAYASVSCHTPSTCEHAVAYSLHM